MSQLLELHGIRKSFGENLVLDDISLSFPQGSATVIIGASGSGKSTLMRCINLLEELSDGQILLEGNDISQYGINLDSVRGKIGSVFQAFNLFPHLTVLENITLAPRLVLKKSKEEATAQAMALLKRFGLADKAGAYPNLLSGGQQQRVAVARALASRPRIILADEPTGNLDSTTGTEILKFMRTAVDELGQTIVMVTHDPVAASYADRIVFLADGKIAGEMLEPTAEKVLDRMKSLGN